MPSVEPMYVSGWFLRVLCFIPEESRQSPFPRHSEPTVLCGSGQSRPISFILHSFGFCFWEQDPLTPWLAQNRQNIAKNDLDPPASTLWRLETLTVCHHIRFCAVLSLKPRFRTCEAGKLLCFQQLSIKGQPGVVPRRSDPLQCQSPYVTNSNPGAKPGSRKQASFHCFRKFR